MSRIIKIKDLLGVDICIDVYDDYVDELQINFSGPIWLTSYGRSLFSDVLDIEIDVDDDDQVAEVLLNDRPDPEHDLECVAKFFLFRGRILFR